MSLILTEEEIELINSIRQKKPICIVEGSITKNLEPSRIKVNEKYFAHVKVGSDMQFLTVLAKSEPYLCEYSTSKGKNKEAWILDVWGFDCGWKVIDIKELRELM